MRSLLHVRNSRSRLAHPVAAVLGGVIAATAVAAPVLAAARSGAMPRPVPHAAGPVVISSNTRLTSDLVCTTLLVKSGVTLTTAGHNIYCSISVTNQGTIVTGPSAAVTYSTSYGGSGAGATGGSGTTGTGRSTRSPGGKPCASKGCAAGNGSTPPSPTGVTDAVLSTWQGKGMGIYLAGAHGGTAGTSPGGAGAFGLAIRTAALTAGKIVASGTGGRVGSGNATAGGGGGGGSLVLEYSSSYKAGSYSLAGGSDRLSNGKVIDVGGHGLVILVKGPPLTAPKITKQPSATSVHAGQTATFTSTASGNPTPTVQWQILTNAGWVNVNDGAVGDGSTISGATTGTLTISSVQPDENGNDYWAVFTNSQGGADSSGAILTVTAALAAPTVTAQPSDATKAAGGTATFTSGASGNPAPTVQWQIDEGGNWNNLSNGTLGDGSTVSGSTTGTLTISGLNADEDANSYRALFTNSSAPDGVGSDAATLTVLFQPTVTEQPADRSAVSGTTTTFTVSSGGDPAPTLQWQQSPDGTNWTNLSDTTEGDGSVVSGSATDTVSIANVQLDEDQTHYRAVLTNSQGSVDSSAARLTVTPAASAPTVTEQPGAASVTAGDTATFTAAASGSPTPTVQWQASPDGTNWTNLSDGAAGDGSTISGSTTGTLTIEDTQLDENGNQYRAVFSNSAAPDGVDSNGAVLTVTATPPSVTESPAPATAAPGGTAMFTAAASGSPAPTVQWQASPNGSTWTDLADGTVGDGSTISGSTTGTLTISGVQPDEDQNQYRAVFTNVAAPDGVDSNPATLTVSKAPPMVTEQPQSTSVGAGGTATFTSTASGNPVPTVQWQIDTQGGWINLVDGTQADGSVISGSQTETLTISNAQPDENNADYWAVFTNSQAPNGIDSNGAFLTVTSTPPTITEQPSPLAEFVTVGGTATWTSTASGSPAPTVVWQIDTPGGWVNLVNGTQADGSIVSGATADTVTISNVQADENFKYYWAVFTNSAAPPGGVDSDSVYIYVTGGARPRLVPAQVRGSWVEVRSFGRGPGRDS